jgi:nitrite reductase/ring-hydroxylating ferredoxin subunit
VADGCFSCPWHGSRFDARTGEVRRGPASIPQPVYETRPSGEGIEVRRQEIRALRLNPI